MDQWALTLSLLRLLNPQISNCFDSFEHDVISKIALIHDPSKDAQTVYIMVRTRPIRSYFDPDREYERTFLNAASLEATNIIQKRMEDAGLRMGGTKWKFFGSDPEFESGARLNSPIAFILSAGAFKCTGLEIRPRFMSQPSEPLGRI
ncbi:hypothetical protein VNO77_34388 [Canavalia gladiata]|uniref:Uncharacterized protein n=1 Tax=Canavalia gladiata TaxID=3824 RepID=A0AAN9KE56_CANGL